ncbi:MAG: MBL fold metallo-hydrolase [Rhodospirillaceae bacterium]|jgi:sulfur dioxygenase|nr:MBL fold metallo-hydrolase [Rhodospirillaceae bacterium]
MLLRQLFDSESCTFTYLLASGTGAEALIIDPVVGKLDRYLTLLDELELHLVKAIDTHVHADHITALGELRDKTNCITVMGNESSVDVVSMRVEDGDKIEIDGICLDAIYTPGHTNDSYCFYAPGMVFTGDTLFIRGTGRTDFQHGSAQQAYDSLFNKILTMPDETIVYPGHDYKGDSTSTIGEEKAFNPRLQVSSANEYAEIMDNLGLPNPKMMDVAVPANQQIGMAQEEPEITERTIPAIDAISRKDGDAAIFIDLREDPERSKNGVIPNSVHVPYASLADFIKPGGMLAALSQQSDCQLMLYCAYGERSAMALKELRAAGFKNVRHLGGGIDAWVNAEGPIEAAPTVS